MTVLAACFPTLWDHTISRGPCLVTLRHGGKVAESRGTGEAAYAPFNLDGASQGYFVHFTLPDPAEAASTTSPHLWFRFNRRPGVGRHAVGVTSDSTDVEYVSATITTGQPESAWSSGVGAFVVRHTDAAHKSLSGTFDLRFAAADRPDTLEATGTFALSASTTKISSIR